jgi:DNA-binding transcriptional ArsR family regulator
VQPFLQLAKALSDETRVRALLAVKDGELCLCQIIKVLGLSPSTVSKHMNVLQQAGLVRRRKQGKWHFYGLATEESERSVQQALAWALEALSDEATVARDAAAVRAVRKQDLEELSACYRL